MRIWVLLALAAGCVGSTADTSDVSQEVAGKTKCKPHKKHADCGTATATIDVNGGTITADTGASITIPYGALDTPTTITVTTTTQATPSGGTSPVYEFGPEGTVFAKPLTVTLPLPTGVTTGSVYWSQLGSTTAYDPIGGTIDLASNTITAQTFHFSLAYIGQPSPTRTVSGGGSTTYISASAYTNVPTDFSTTPVGAIVGDGAGGYTELSGGAGSNAGLFTIPNVPTGEYIAHAGPYYMVTTSNSPDLGIDQGGRANEVPITSAELDLTLQNLAPWDLGGSNANDVPDQIEWFSSEADDWDFGADGRNPLAATQTSVTLPVAMKTVLTSTARPAAEITATDHAAAGQLVLQHTTSGVPYLAMQRVAQFPAGFSIASNQTVPVPLTMNDVSLGTTLSIDYRGDTFKQVLDTYGHPGHEGPGDPDCVSGQCGGFAGALAQAWTANEGFYAANADLLLMYDNIGERIVSGDMHYADPAALGGQWDVLFTARWTMRTPLQLPGTCGRRGLGSFFGFVDYADVTTTLAVAQSQPVTPKVLPPANIQVNGVPFFQGGHDLGGAATITWDDPNDPATTGTLKPSFYTIEVIEVFVDANNNSHAKRVAHISTPDRSFTFFPYKDASGQTQQILQAGHSYLFTLAAVASTSSDPADVARLESAPFKSTNQIADAGVTSGIFGDNHGAGCLQPIQDNQNYPLGTAANATNVFWVERGQAPWDPPTARFAGNIWTANLDGSNPHIIASGIDEPLEVAAIGNTIYWLTEGDGTGGSGGVWSMDLATSTITQIAPASNPNGLMVYSGDLYWMGGEGTSRLHNGAVSLLSPQAGGNIATDGTSIYMTRGTEVDSMPLAGGPLTLLVDNQPDAWGVATDGAFVYWSDQNWQVAGSSTINRTPVGGGAAETLVTGNELQKWFTMDASNLYFVRDGFVWSLPKTGGAPSALAAVPGSPGCPQDQLTVAAGALYFTDTCGSMGTYRVPLP